MASREVRVGLTDHEVAVIGMACQFPGAASTAEFWRNLCDGTESLKFFSEEELRSEGVPRRILGNPNYVKAQGVLADADLFDAAFFGINPKEANLMDPQHRLLLECAWEALEDSAYDPDRIEGAVGMFAGAYRNDYLSAVDCGDDPIMVFLRDIANEADYLATRVSYKLNLRGPSLTVQTACSTSLVAVHLAGQSLRVGECDVALAGGVTVHAGEYPGYLYREGGIFSPDGHTRAFDIDAQGTGVGDGIGVVVLKRLADALDDGDNIRAVIKGSAVGNTGGARVGFTAPGVDGQARVIRAAQANAGVAPDTIAYIEAHGTGTPLGDRIEISALTRAFEADTRAARSCAIGSVKTNIGHTHAAAGVAGFIKTVLALEHKMIPPSLHFARPNPRIDFESSPFYVNTKLVDWKTNGAPRRAGVSSFGLGGTEAHVVLEEAPARRVPGRARPWPILSVSARTETALEAATDRLAEHLDQHPDVSLADAAYTLHLGRRVFRHRRAIVARDRDETVAALRARDPTSLHSNVCRRGDRPLAFMFPGLGDQYMQMGHELYQSESVFREEVDRCVEFLRVRSGLDLRPLICADGHDRDPPSSQGGRTSPGQGVRLDLRQMLNRDRPPADERVRTLNDTRYVQPAMFVIEYALARLWMHWGVRPDALIGYSIGEYVAACLAEVFALEDALAVVAERARLIGELPAGSMLAVPLDEGQVLPMLDPNASLAAVNGPSLCVVSGPSNVVAGLEERLRTDGVAARRLQTSHAFHSKMMEPIGAKLKELLEGITLHPPSVPYLSNLTGDWITARQATDPRYWCRHMCEAVRFTDGVEKLWQDAGRILLEVGPGQTLGSLALQARRRNASDLLVLASLPSLYNRESELHFLLCTLAKLWLAGVPVDWEAFHAAETCHRVPLPPYPFQRQRHSIESKPRAQTGKPRAQTGQSTQLVKNPDLADWFSVPTWEPLPPLPAAPKNHAEDAAHWLLFVDTCGVGERIASSLEERGHTVTTVIAGDCLRRLGGRRYTVNLAHAADYDTLIQEVQRSDGLLHKIVHLWMVTPEKPARPDSDSFEEVQQRGFFSLLFLAQALGKHDLTEPVDVSVISSHMHTITGVEISCPEKATVLGPCQVWAREYPHVRCRNIDISLHPPDTWRQDRAIDRLLAELLAAVDEPVIGHRGSTRWRQTYFPIRLEEAKDGLAPWLRDGGTYLITGGLGGIGLVLAKYLARTLRAKVVLTSRSALPPRSEWQQWLATHGEDDETATKICQINELEAAGGDALVLSADVADLAQMRSVVDRARERFGAIHGVIHAAGIPGAGLMQLKTPEAAARVMAPKVQGARVLEALWRDLDLDFVAFFSSTLALTGGLGQVDYCAANAFLDALAHHHEAVGGPRIVSINWDAWQEVGITARLVGEGRNRQPSESVPLEHPLLDHCVVDTARHAIYTANFSVAKTWLIHEHRISGNAVFPGTGYLELIRAAFARHDDGDSVEITDVSFLTPLVVSEDETTEVRVVLERQEDAYRCSVISKCGRQHAQGTQWQLHSTGKIRRLRSTSRPDYDVGALIRRAGLRDIGRPINTGPMQFGPRFSGLERMYVGDQEFLAFIELPSEFAGDLDCLKLHPSLLDTATAFAAIHAPTEFRLPISYKSIRLKAPLQRRLYSYLRYSEGDRAGKETVSADITIMDEDGRELVCIEGFVLKRVGDLEARLTRLRNGTAADFAPYHLPDTEVNGTADGGLLRTHLEEGMLPSEGVEAFFRVLSAELTPQVVIATKELDAIIAETKRTPFVRGDGAHRGTAGTQVRPNLLTPYTAPRNEVERALASLWQELLGVEEIGVHDNFFELGGHSLLGLQLVTQLHDSFDIEIGPGVLFEAPTVAGLAAALPTLGKSKVAEKWDTTIEGARR